MRAYAIVITLLSVMALAIAKSPERNTRMEAIAYITGPTGVVGNVTFIQNACGENVHLRVYITGLTPGKHGFHIHEKGDLSKGCMSLGGHYNPEKMDHGGQMDEIRHNGDLSNVEADVNGVVDTTISDHVISLNGPRTIIGRSVVVHDGVDDEGKTTHPDSKKTGNAGGRAGCGVIGVKPHSPILSCSPSDSNSNSNPSPSRPRAQPTFYVPHDKPSDQLVYPIYSSSYPYPYNYPSAYGSYQSFPYYYR